MTKSHALVYPQLNVFTRASTTSSWATSASLIAADLLALSTIYWFAVIGRYLFYPNYTIQFYLELYPVIGIFIAGFSMHGLYPGILLHPAEEIRRVFKCVTTVLLVVALGTFLSKNGDSYSRSIFLTLWACGAPSILLARQLTRKLLSKRSWWGVPAVILGSGPCAERVIEKLTKRNRGLRVVGILSDNLSTFPATRFTPVLGNSSTAPYLARLRFAQYAIVAMPEKTNEELRYLIQNFCRGFRHILLVPDLPGICTLGITAHEVGGEVGLELPQRLCHASTRFAKRTFDTLASMAGLIVLAPLFLLVSAAIKCSSNGPVLFGHLRYGQNGEVFRALKFRTMVQNADRVLSAHLALHPELREEWLRDRKLRKDPRIISIGKWLRRYSLDELPQLINVLFGQMSLVGPRPIVKDEIEKYGVGYDLYTRVSPGITGLWQVSGRNHTTYPERVAFDEYYVRNWSIWLDAYILVKTLRAVATADGAY